MFKKIVNKLDFWDIGLVKFSVAAFVLALIALFPSFALWVELTNPWYFILAFIIFAIRPIYRIWFKK